MKTIFNNLALATTPDLCLLIVYDDVIHNWKLDFILFSHTNNQNGLCAESEKNLLCK